jgi:hypothetical protein
MEQFFGWMPLWVAGMVSLAMLPALVIAGKMTSKRLTKAEHLACATSVFVGGYGVLSVMAQTTRFIS